MKSEFSNWSDVRVFLAVLREGSTLAASKTLGLAQPTVARRIDALEHTTGLTLFLRDTRGFRPTEAAQVLKGHAEAIEAAAGDFANAVADLCLADKRPIRFTAAPEVFTENFAAIISDFNEVRPEVRFDFMATAKTLDIAAGEADVAIRYANSIDDPEIICRKMSETLSTLYAADSYITKRGLPRSEADLADPVHRYVLFNRSTSQFREWLLERVAPEQIVMECETYNSLMAAVMSGFGIGALGTGIGDLTPSLRRVIPPPAEIGPSITWLLTSPEAHKRPEVRAFTAFFAPRYSALMKRQRKEREALVAEREARDNSAP